MNIIVITDTLDLGGGGVGTCVNDLCMAFAKNNHRILLAGVVDYQYKNDYMIETLCYSGVDVFNIGAKSRSEALLAFPKYVKKLREYMRKWSNNEPAICNVHLKMGVLYGALASVGLNNIKCVETYHNTYHSYHLQCWALSPIIKKYICVSNTAKGEMHQRFKISNNRLIAIPNGIDRNLIRNSVITHKEKTENCLVLSVGRLSPEKNILTAIKAFRDIKEVSFKYIVIGDGPERQEADNLVTPRVELLGQVSREEVLSYLSIADIVVMPSLWEGRSILMLEAAAFDVPFIISDVPGLREPFDAKPLGQNEPFRRTDFGYLVQTNNIDAYRNALVDFINNREKHEEMRMSIRKMSENNDLSRVVEEYARVFQSVLFNH